MEVKPVPEPPTRSLAEREVFMMRMFEQQFAVCATALGDDSDFGRELAAASRGLQRRLRRLQSQAEDPRAPRRLRLVPPAHQALVAVLPFLVL